MTKEVFAQVYQTYFGQVYAYLLSLCKNRDLAEELTSETFFRALQKLDGFRGDCQLGVWLCQIGKRQYFDHLRKSRPAVPLEEASDTADPSLPGPEEHALQAEGEMTVYERLHRLKEPYKEVFLLRAMGQLSFRQIGRLFGKSENWACVTYHRARARLKDELEGEYEA